MSVYRMMRRERVTLLAIPSALLLIALSACGGDTTAPPDTGPVVSSISVWPCGCFSYSGGPERTIGILGTSVRFSAAFLAQDGTVLYDSHEQSARFSWSSSDPDVATVEAMSGPLGGSIVVVTGVSDGTATITATSEGVTGTFTVTVRDRARLAWSVPLPGEHIESDIAIGADGTIYVVTFGGGASRWFAVSPQGAVLWTLDLPNSFSTPAIAADGTLYAGLLAGGLIAVSPGGTVRWTLWDLDPINSPPAIGSDGTIYVAGGHNVYAIDPQGKIRWAYKTPDRVFTHSSPAVASDGTIYVGGKSDGRLYAIKPDGSLRWTFDTGKDNYIYSGPSIDRDGTIYFGALGGLYAVGPDGTGGGRLLDRTVSRTPSIGPDGTVYVGAGWGTGGYGVVAIDPGGSVRWSSRPSTYSTPILGADGTVYVTATGPSGEPTISALDRQGRLQWDYVPPGTYSHGFNVSPAIGVDGAILGVSRDPVVLYAIVEKSGADGGYAGAPWPTARRNRANTGRAGG